MKISKNVMILASLASRTFSVYFRYIAKFPILKSSNLDLEEPGLAQIEY